MSTKQEQQQGQQTSKNDPTNATPLPQASLSPLLERSGRLVVVAVDASPGSMSALRWALANMCDMQKDVLHLVHSYQPLESIISENTDYAPSGEGRGRESGRTVH